MKATTISVTPNVTKRAASGNDYTATEFVYQPDPSPKFPARSPTTRMIFEDDPIHDGVCMLVAGDRFETTNDTDRYRTILSVKKIQGGASGEGVSAPEGDVITRQSALKQAVQHHIHQAEPKTKDVLNTAQLFYLYLTNQTDKLRKRLSGDLELPSSPQQIPPHPLLDQNEPKHIEEEPQRRTIQQPQEEPPPTRQQIQESYNQEVSQPKNHQIGEDDDIPF